MFKIVLRVLATVLMLIAALVVLMHGSLGSDLHGIAWLACAAFFASFLVP